MRAEAVNGRWLREKNAFFTVLIVRYFRRLCCTLICYRPLRHGGLQ